MGKFVIQDPKIRHYNKDIRLQVDVGLPMLLLCLMHYILISLVLQSPELDYIPEQANICTFNTFRLTLFYTLEERIYS